MATANFDTKAPDLAETLDFLRITAGIILSIGLASFLIIYGAVVAEGLQGWR